ncbi:MAG: alpha/beta fold hydrolase [Bryobacterales bacterium]|jgi:pimeloyl-ACP methyl ester carboxylesterase|nr:alpha/beta fold hydrolase [Bryobacterales bacterium]
MFAHIPRWLRIIVYVQLALVIAIPLGGWLLQSQREGADSKRFPPPGKLVDVGGYRVHLYCMGQRGQGPLVVFNADSGDQGLIFRGIQERLKGSMRTCAIDRGGFGWSEPGLNDRSVPAAARELHAALQAAGEAGPYLWVGHGLGALHVLAYRGLHPGQVAGALLLDPTPPECLKNRFDGIIAEAEAPYADVIREKLDQVIADRGACPEGEGGTRLYSWLARIGMVRALAGRNFDPTSPSADLLETHRALKLRTAHADAVVQESATCYVRIQQAATALLAWKPTPMAILTRGRMGNFFEDQEFLSRRADDATLAFENAQLRYLSKRHQQMAQQAGGSHRVASASAHYIQLSEPDLVVEIVERLWREASSAAPVAGR